MLTPIVLKVNVNKMVIKLLTNGMPLGDYLMVGHASWSLLQCMVCVSACTFLSKLKCTFCMSVNACI